MYPIPYSTSASGLPPRTPKKGPARSTKELPVASFAERNLDWGVSTFFTRRILENMTKKEPRKGPKKGPARSTKVLPVAPFAERNLACGVSTFFPKRILADQNTIFLMKKTFKSQKTRIFADGSKIHLLISSFWTSGLPPESQQGFNRENSPNHI